MNPPPSSPLSRRTFLKGLGTSAVAVASAQVGAVADEIDKVAGGPSPQGPGAVPVTLTINGEPRTLQLEPRVTLLEALRYETPLTGTKEVCDRGTCGACSVLIDGRLTYSCMKLAIDAQGQKITTVEGLAQNGTLTPVQQAFVECDALMCGFCTPGLVMAVTALMNEIPHPDRGAGAARLRGQSLSLRHLSTRHSRRAQGQRGRGAAQILGDRLWQPGLIILPSSAGQPSGSTARPRSPARRSMPMTCSRPGVLWGAVLRAKWPAAQVTKIDLSVAQAMPGVKAAILAGGEQRQVRFYGQELAAGRGHHQAAVPRCDPRDQGRGDAAALRRA